MFAFLKSLFSTVNYIDLLQRGAIIVDVRSIQEFESGHIPTSINIPLPTIASNLKKLDNTKPIITCCASGIRSASAKAILKSNGFKEVINGGGWSSLYNKLDK
jgi:rhodanese-related sulfurtransferase